ncbi:MAG: hypothetical protein JST16_12865 [Bdellovibrionales bacterium]|nr:hypothetical protein [Bdellovibrionales bacterium]
MKHVKIVGLGVAFFSFACAARGQTATSRGVGTGIAYPAPGQALVANPAALADGPNLAVTGMYRTNVDLPFGSVGYNGGILAAGADYRKEGDGNLSANVYEGGAAFHLGALRLGATLRKTENVNDLDGDVGAIFALGRLRLAGVARSVNGKVDRFDAGLGINVNSVLVEFDVKKPREFDQNFWLIDAAIGAGNEMITVSVGYDVTYNGVGQSGQFEDGKLHAGVSAQVSHGVYLEAFYRPLAQEWSIDKWGFGGRVIF